MERQHYETGVQHRFDCFCKKVLKYTLINFYREKNRQNEREIAFSDMSEREFAGIAISDVYFAEEHKFYVLGETVSVADADLAKALNALPANRLEIVLMSYFLGMNDREIAEQLNMVRGTVNYRKNSSLKKLKNLLKG